eukprot:scaffold523_cov237-Pinguiococcus_pyrenoidosus.AAC.3
MARSQLPILLLQLQELLFPSSLLDLVSFFEPRIPQVGSKGLLLREHQGFSLFGQRFLRTFVLSFLFSRCTATGFDSGELRSDLDPPDVRQVLVPLPHEAVQLAASFFCQLQRASRVSIHLFQTLGPILQLLRLGHQVISLKLRFRYARDLALATGENLKPTDAKNQTHGEAFPPVPRDALLCVDTAPSPHELHRAEIAKLSSPAAPLRRRARGF